MTVKANLISKLDYFQYFGEKPEQHDSYKVIYCKYTSHFQDFLMYVIDMKN